MTYTSVAHVQPQQAESPKWYSSSPIERQYPTAWCKLEFESFLNTDSKSGTRCAVCLFIRIDKRLLITRHIRPVYTLRCYMAVSTIALSPILQESYCRRCESRLMGTVRRLFQIHFVRFCISRRIFFEILFLWIPRILYVILCIRVPIFINIIIE